MSEPHDRAEVAFHPPILLGLALGLGFFLRRVAAVSLFPPQVSASLGPIVLGLAFGLFFWTVFTMLKGNASIPTNRPTDALVANGPFRFSRNPIYLAMLVLQMSAGIWANSIWFFGLAALSAMLLSWGVISREEQYLERKFGARYTAYKARVRRWL